MKKTILALTALAALAAGPVLAQNALNSTANTGDGIGTFGHSNWKFTGAQAKEDPSTPAPSLWGQGWADYTNSNGAGTPNLPELPGEGTPSRFSGPGGFSGASTAAPRLGSFDAPGSFALRQMGRKSLPPTRLESFVRNSGFDDHIYGDEGEDGLPPYFGFTQVHRIERGIFMPELTTGHKSDAPEAWGYPQ